MARYKDDGRRPAHSSGYHSAQPAGRRPQSRQDMRNDGRRSGTGAGLIVGVLLVLAVAAVLFFLVILPQCSKKEEPAAATTPQTVQQVTEPATPTAVAQTPAAQATVQPDASSWELTLVNATHPLPDDWSVNVVQVRDSKYIDERIADQLEQMVADCAAAGYDDVFINEGYRSHERQQEIWDEFYDMYLSQGYSEEEALAMTGESVAVPGTSEHELGLAADICSINFDEEYNAPIQTWLKENGWKYGFIQRYPAGKESVTGIKNENWHFRYVGVEAAKAMHDSGQVLEEYLGLV